MNEFKVIVVMNEALLKTLKEKNKNYDTNLKIKEMLKDEAIFFKMNKENSYNILKNVGVKQDAIETVYKKLIAPNMFYDLLNRGIINETDESLIIKYENYRK